MRFVTKRFGARKRRCQERSTRHQEYEKGQRSERERREVTSSNQRSRLLCQPLRAGLGGVIFLDGEKKNVA